MKFRSVRKVYNTDEALKRMQVYCAREDRCQQDVVEKLNQVGIYGSERDEIIVSLISDGFIDETRYAKAYVSGKFSQNQWGRIKIRQGLKMKGISDFCIRTAMEVIDEEAYEVCLERLMEKKQGTAEFDSSYEGRSKLMRYALGKGYESEICSKIIRKLTSS